ncbi:MAG: hypothetical protein IPO92_13910 [Saprospiraceae bacterium]|nr:hypothetical protein [Saprospiraceae bacterium]
MNQNHIYTTGRCINSIESSVSIKENYLDVSGVLSGFLFPKVKGCIISGTNKEGSQITNNFLVANGANYGIFSEYESNTFVNNNDVKFKVPNGSRSAAIDVSGIIDGNVDGNIVDGDPWARGIQLQNTMGTNIQCNEVINSNVSLNILHNSDNHTIKANTLTGTDDLNIRSLIGPQPEEGQNHHGNKFVGGTVKAIGLSDDEIRLSRFRVQPMTPYLPPNRTPAEGWFFRENNKPMETCSTLQITPGPGWTPDPMRLCTYYAYLKTIKDSLPERFFINLFHLLKYEKLNPGFALPPCIKNDSTLAQLCGIKKLAEISFVLDTLGTHKSLTKDVRMLRDQYLKSNTPTTKHNLEQSIKSEWSSIYTKLPAVKLKDSLALDSLKGELNKLFCDSLVHKWKEIYKLYIDFKQHKRVLASDTTAIKTYSSKCAAQYGDAIHLARVMASTFTDQDYTVNDDCIALPENRNKQGYERANDISVFPNPSTGLVSVSLPEIM